MHEEQHKHFSTWVTRASGYFPQNGFEWMVWNGGLAPCWAVERLLELLQQRSQKCSQMCANKQIPSMTDASDSECVNGASSFFLSLKHTRAHTHTHLPLTGRNRPACALCRNTDLVPGCLSEPVWRREWETFPKLRWPPPGKNITSGTAWKMNKLNNKRRWKLPCTKLANQHIPIPDPTGSI